MTEHRNDDLSPDELDDEINESLYPRPEESDFAKLVDRVISHRDLLRGSAAFGATALVLGAGSLLPSGARAAGRWLPFEPVAANTADTVTVPKGFSWQTVVSWGDPLWSHGAEFDHASRGTGASQELAYGDNTDGMWLFTKDGRMVLAANNEYVNRKTFHGNRPDGKPINADDVRKSKAGHGNTVIELKNDGGRWSIVKDSVYNRRITADTPMELTGPARGHDLVKTAADPTACSRSAPGTTAPTARRRGAPT